MTFEVQLASSKTGENLHFLWAGGKVRQNKLRFSWSIRSRPREPVMWSYFLPLIQVHTPSLARGGGYTNMFQFWVRKAKINFNKTIPKETPRKGVL